VKYGQNMAESTAKITAKIWPKFYVSMTS